MTNNFNAKVIDELIRFRKKLHQKPELSGQEKHTPQLILDFLDVTEQQSVIKQIGGNGMAVVYDSNKPGPTTVFRCELDAVPIQEINTFPHHSQNVGVSHKCGHDGHMAIVTGLGVLLKDHPPLRGKIVLLYQPAEETGMGAEAVLKDGRFTALKPDFMYALHNVPLLTKNTIYTKSKAFAAASRGIIIKLHGATSHAAEPENGKNPALALSEIIREISILPKKDLFEDFTLITIVHVLLGEIAFGVSPGYAEIRATLRTFQKEDMEKLIEEAKAIVYKISDKEGLKAHIDFTEIFPATCNDDEAVSIIEKCAVNNNISVEKMDQPFKWSEDFGHFLDRYKGAIFALGAGKETPKLHNNDYDFPDELIPTGVQLFYTLAQHHNF